MFDIRDFGAVGDGKTLNTKYIQKAIEACFEAGGGRVLVAGGKYMTGSIRLKSNVELHIAADGVLLGSPNCSDYPEWENLVHITKELLPRNRSACMIFAEECENISLTGIGTIDCNGKSFVEPEEDENSCCYFRRIDAPTPPRVVFFTGCRNVTVENVTMVNQPPGWSYWIHDCDYVTFDRVKIIAALEYPNNDGIHINSSRNVTISNSNISCGDDCIIVRANNSSLAENKVCEKVTVTNCNLTSWSGGIRVGWIKDGTIRNCTFSNLVMTDTSVGISILLPGRGAERVPDEGREKTRIENLSFSNIVMDSCNSNAILVHIHDNPAAAVEAVRNLYFSDIHATSCELPYLCGRADCLLENIYFNNCTFERTGSCDPRHGYFGIWDRRTTDTIGDLYINYSKNVVLNNTAITIKSPFAWKKTK